MWRELIKKAGGEVTDSLDLSCLAKISDGYTQGHMVQVVREILTEHRLQQLAKRPLTAAEFVSPLAKTDPVFHDEEEALKVKYLTNKMYHAPNSESSSDWNLIPCSTGTQKLLWARSGQRLPQKKMKRRHQLKVGKSQGKTPRRNKEKD